METVREIIPFRRRISFYGRIQTVKKLVVSAIVNFPQRNNYACADVQFSRLVLCVGSAPYVAAPPLKRRAQLLLRQSGLRPETPQIVAHIPVPSDFLLHFVTPLSD